MKIVFFIPSLHFGGAERVTSILANHFCDKDKVIVITEAKHSEKEYELDTRIKRICLSSKLKPLYIFEIRKIIKNLNPDVCIIMFAPQYSYIYFSLKGLKIKQIVSERNDPVNFSGHKTNKVVYQQLLKKADGIVFQTSDASKYYFPDGAAKSIIIPNPIVISSLPEVYKGERSKRVVNVGRLHEQKNQKMLIEAFLIVHRYYPDYRLEIYGDGPLKNSLNSVISDANAKSYIILKGATNMLFESIIDSSLFVLSSNYEGMPNALIEALCLGIPTISTDCPCGGPKDLIINGNNGRLVPVGDVQSLANTIMEVLSDENAREKYSYNGYHIRERLDSNVIAMKWYDFCKTIIAKH